MKRSTILDGIRVASPCQANWDLMSGDDQARFCSLCRKNVYNLSAMTTAEAVAFVADREEEICVRFYRRADGTTLTSDCPVGVEEKRGRKARFRMIAGLGLVGLAMGSTVLAAVGLRTGSNIPAPSGPGVSIDDWIDWAMIKVGWRKPHRMVMGALPINRNCNETTSADDY